MTRPMRITLVAMSAFALVVAAAPAAKPDLKTYFASDFTDQAYQQKTHRKVGASWQRPAEAPKAGSKAVVIATFLRDGSLMEAKIHMKSGSEDWDDSALKAVRKASPLDPLPKEYKRTSVEIHFHFEMNPD